MGELCNEVIDIIIDFWTGGISVAWGSDKLIKVREVVESNLLQTI